jgi:glycerol uptake facilitator-like aquaporin
MDIAVEYLGTVFFLYVIIITGNPLAIGAALALACYLAGPISGGNFNPAVTILMVVAKKQPVSCLVPYIAAQFAAALTVYYLYTNLKHD